MRRSISGLGYVAVFFAGGLALSVASVLVIAGLGRTRQAIMQLAFALVGMVAAAVIYRCERLSPGWWHEKSFWRWTIALAVLALLAVVQVPKLGVDINGAHRWIRIGSLSLQPSEFAKVLSILVVSTWAHRQARRRSSLLRMRDNPIFSWHILWPYMWLGLCAVLLFFQKDAGSLLVLSALSLMLLWMGQSPTRLLVLVAVVGALALFVWLLHDKERWSRMMSAQRAGSEVELSEEARADAHQVIMAQSALLRGGWTGCGWGKSLYKEKYLPENHTDFIFAIVGEEFGAVGNYAVLFVYLCLVGAGFRLSTALPTRAEAFAAYGLSCYLGINACWNMGMIVSRSIPVKGLALPFMSYGGSSMLASWMLVGILASLSQRVPTRRERMRERMYAAPAPSSLWIH